MKSDREVIIEIIENVNKLVDVYVKIIDMITNIRIVVSNKSARAIKDVMGNDDKIV